MNYTKSVAYVFSGLLSVSLIGCGGSSSSGGTLTGGSDDTKEVAVVAAVGSDFSSSSISVVEDTAAPDIVNGLVPTDQSDITVATHGDYFYRIGRYGQDNITKYSFSDPGKAEWQFSVNQGEQTGANPYDLIFVNEQKAYVLRYGAGEIWIVNPSVAANDEANFKTGEIDLSVYDSTDNVPEMSNAVLHDGKLYVSLQGLQPGFIPGQAWLVVIDTATDQEVVTGRGGSLPGIPLTIKNPVDLDYNNGNLYITGIGRYASRWSGTPAEYTGGIERIELADFSSELVLDDGDDDNHPYGQINGMEMVSESMLVFRGYASFGDETLYSLDLSNGQVSDLAFAGIADQDVRSITLDSSGRLWVGLGGDAPLIQVLTNSGELVSELTLTQIPSRIVFGSK